MACYTFKNVLSDMNDFCWKGLIKLCIKRILYKSKKGERQYLKLEKCIPVKTTDKNDPTVYYRETSYRKAKPSLSLVFDVTLRRY